MEDEEVMGGSKVMSNGDKARRARHEKREKLRNLKRLAHIDAYDKEDTLTVSDADEAIEDMLLFMTDPMVKAKLSATQFKTINNSLVDILSVLEEVEKTERKKFKKVK